MLPLKDTGPRVVKFPLWVLTIIIINIVVFYFELTSANPDTFITQHALVPSTISIFHPMTLFTFITSQFLHGGFLHIASNMWFLWIFGDNVEDKLGYFFFPIFYLASGIVGNVVQYFFMPSSPIPVIGASGAIAGVLGAYYAFFPRNKVKTLIFILIFVTIFDLPSSFILFYWFILQLFSSAIAVSPAAASFGGDIAYFAHIGGFVLGWLVARIFYQRMELSQS
ncbi:MAG: rhomboid family intramembrane serine protease [Patescibacteria group bacterium]|nr:rhomboid family intramembrane serine protease [Patescibacteria group bacterium]